MARRWPFVAAAAAFAILATPIVLSGQATDRRLHQARRHRHLAGLHRSGGRPRTRPRRARWSTYEATLRLNIGDGYPIGVFIPLGIGSKLLATDPAWLIQPYMATLGAMLSLGLWSLASPLAGSPRVRALAAAIGSVSALLVGYYLWAASRDRRRGADRLDRGARGPSPRRAAPPRAAGRSGGHVGGADRGAERGRGPLAAADADPGGRAARRPDRDPCRAGPMRGGRDRDRGPERPDAGRGGDRAADVIAARRPGGAREPARPLDLLQLSGIWGAGDFRLPTDDELLTTALIAIALIAAVAGIAWAIARRELGPPLFALGSSPGAR